MNDLDTSEEETNRYWPDAVPSVSQVPAHYKYLIFQLCVERDSVSCRHLCALSPVFSSQFICYSSYCNHRD